LRNPHRVQISISVLQEFAKISLCPVARVCRQISHLSLS
jgi:hypothetical protein